jgi:hypothetical protein
MSDPPPCTVKVPELKVALPAMPGAPMSASLQPGGSPLGPLTVRPTVVVTDGLPLASVPVHSSGLQAHGYQYVNVDDFWYKCPNTVDSFGRWAVDTSKFPPPGPHQPGPLRPLPDDQRRGAGDQAGIPASPLVAGATQQVWRARQPDGSYYVGLFNLDTVKAPR